MDREESGMSPGFRLRFGHAQFEMLVEREPRWGVPPAFGKRPGTTALSETTRGQQTLGGVRCQSVSAFYHALSLSLVAPSLIPISPPAQTPASEHLMGSPSRLIAQEGYQESTFKAPLCLCTCCSFGSQRACLSPSRVPPSIPFPFVPLKTLFLPDRTALFLDSRS